MSKFSIGKNEINMAIYRKSIIENKLKNINDFKSENTKNILSIVELKLKKQKTELQNKIDLYKWLKPNCDE